MRTHESQEMYLETILLLRMRKANVRAVDIVDELGYAKSSVSRAVNLLQDDGLIDISTNGDITLTEKGLKRAETVYENTAFLPMPLSEWGLRLTLRRKMPAALSMSSQTNSSELSKNTFPSIKFSG